MLELGKAHDGHAAKGRLDKDAAQKGDTGSWFKCHVDSEEATLRAT